MRQLRILDVTELTAYLKDLLDSDPILADVWIRGEVSNFTRSAAGHCYFSLKSPEAQIKCVLFRGNARGIPVLPVNGDAVIAHGRVSLYEVSGQYQLYVDLLQPDGAGLLQLQFEELRQRLEREGLFEPSRKRPLPRYPRYIGVVTSPTGAVWHDIQHVLRRRYPLAQLILSPSQVQGADAPGQLVAALEALHRDGRAEVIILGRGGGSMEDLWCFNDERLARAIFASPVPVVSAVGHETDFTIADFVADVRAPTPSAAAEIVAPHIGELRGEVLTLAGRARGAVESQVQADRRQVDDAYGRLRRSSPSGLIRQTRLRLDATAERMRLVLAGRFGAERRRIDGMSRQLALLHPVDTMARGYAMVFADDGGRVRSAGELRPGEQVLLRFHDGTAAARVESVTASDGERHAEESGERWPG